LCIDLLALGEFHLRFQNHPFHLCPNSEDLSKPIGEGNDYDDNDGYDH